MLTKEDEGIIATGIVKGLAAWSLICAIVALVIWGVAAVLQI